MEDALHLKAPGFDNNFKIESVIFVNIVWLSLDGWTTCDFMSFSTVFVISGQWKVDKMKECVQWNSVYG